MPNHPKTPTGRKRAAASSDSDDDYVPSSSSRMSLRTRKPAAKRAPVMHYVKKMPSTEKKEAKKVKSPVRAPSIPQEVIASPQVEVIDILSDDENDVLNQRIRLESNPPSPITLSSDDEGEMERLREKTEKEKKEKGEMIKALKKAKEAKKAKETKKAVEAAIPAPPITSKGAKKSPPATTTKKEDTKEVNRVKQAATPARSDQKEDSDKPPSAKKPKKEEGQVAVKDILTEQQMKQLKRNRSPGRFAKQFDFSNQCTRLPKRSRSAESRIAVPSNRLVVDHLYFKIAELRAGANGEKVSIAHINQPLSNFSLQLRVAAMSKIQYGYWRKIREERMKEVEKGELTEKDAVLERIETLLLNGAFEEGTGTPRVSRIEKRQGKPVPNANPHVYPRMQMRVQTEMELLDRQWRSRFSLREVWRRVQEGEIFLLRAFDNFENTMETVDKDQPIDPLTNRPRQPIKLCTRTPASSPDRRPMMVKKWKEVVGMSQEDSFPYPSIDNPDVVKENRDAVSSKNEKLFNRMHEGLNKKLLDLANKHRQLGGCRPVTMSESKKGTGVAWTPECRHNTSSEKFVENGRMWSELPHWFPRDVKKIEELINSTVFDSLHFDNVMSNIDHKEEDFLAKMMIALGANHELLRHPLQVRFAFQKLEYERNEEHKRLEEPLESFFPEQSIYTYLQPEFDREYGARKCTKEDLIDTYFYHPVLMIDPNRSNGSYLRISFTRYPEPLPPGAVRVVVPLGERGDDGEFEEYCRTSLDINNGSVYSGFGMEQYHPFNQVYKAEPTRVYKTALQNAPGFWTCILKFRKAGMQLPAMLHFYYEHELKEKALWPHDRREFSIWFEAMVREWTNSGEKGQLEIRKAEEKDRDEFLKRDHPDLYESVLEARKEREEREKKKKEEERRLATERVAEQKRIADAKRAAQILLSPHNQSTPNRNGGLRTSGSTTNGGASALRKTAHTNSSAVNKGALSTPKNTQRPPSVSTVKMGTQSNDGIEWLWIDGSYVDDYQDQPRRITMNEYEYELSIWMAKQTGPKPKDAVPYTDDLHRRAWLTPEERAREDRTGIKIDNRLPSQMPCNVFSRYRPTVYTPVLPRRIMKEALSKVFTEGIDAVCTPTPSTAKKSQVPIPSPLPNPKGPKGPTGQGSKGPRVTKPKGQSVRFASP